ncbi:hypothetical protein [Aeromicrobium sp. UC242_57]|uniref:hypothetical protein n=1 Tax=Aeromicrobium sp. UC242_57 TaxID=3374624 RepID=UPI003798421A
MVDLTTKLVNVLGDKTTKPLTKAFDMVVVGDLLRHYPRRYVELGKASNLADLRVGQHATVLATIVEAKNYSFGPGGRRTRTEVVVTDDSGARLSLTFFQQRWLQEQMKPGKMCLFSGEVGQFNGRLQLTHPDYDLFDQEGDTATSRLSRGVLPIYRATAKVPTWKIEKLHRAVPRQPRPARRRPACSIAQQPWLRRPAGRTRVDPPAARHGRGDEGP